MKKKTGKRIRYVRLTGVLLALGVLAIAAYGSFGAYTNFNSVKRVVSTGTQTSDTMFSSNYLSLLNSVDTNLPVKRISLADSGEDNYIFTVMICNYVWGAEHSRDLPCCCEGSLNRKRICRYAGCSEASEGYDVSVSDYIEIENYSESSIPRGILTRDCEGAEQLRNRMEQERRFYGGTFIRILQY